MKEFLKNKFKMGLITVEDVRSYTILELIYKVINKVNELIQTVITVEDRVDDLEQNTMTKIEYEEDITNVRKLDDTADFTGSWFGIKNPTYAEPGIAGVVEQQGERLDVVEGNVAEITKKIDWVHLDSFPRLVGEESDDNRIVRALNYCETNNISTLKFGDGDFKVNGEIMLPSNIHLVGANKRTKILHDHVDPSEGEVGLFHAIGKENIKITGFNIIDRGHTLIFEDCNNITVKENRIEQKHSDNLNLTSIRIMRKTGSLLPTCSNFYIKNNELITTFIAVLTQGRKDLYLSNIWCEGNSVTVGEPNVAGSGEALKFDYYSSNVHVLNNVVKGYKLAGISVEEATDDVVVQGNILHSGLESERSYGIRLQWGQTSVFCNRLLIDGNIIDGGTAGIIAEEDCLRHAIISNNVIRKASKWGIYSVGRYVKIIGNRCHELSSGEPSTELAGIFNRGTFATIEDNDLVGNGIYCVDSGRSVVKGNNLFNGEIVVRKSNEVGIYANNLLFASTEQGTGAIRCFTDSGGSMLAIVIKDNVVGTSQKTNAIVCTNEVSNSFIVGNIVNSQAIVANGSAVQKEWNL